MNKYLDLDQQIVHLFVDKSVMFEREEIDVAKKLLRDNNYLNFVSCSKVKFAEFIDEHLMMYKTAEFKEWRAYFDMDCYVSKHLINNLTIFERTINSRVSNYISDLMSKDRLSNYEKNEIISKVIRIQDRNDIKFSEYTGNFSWVYISEMSFGEMKQILLWIYNNRKDDYFQIVNGYNFLNNQVKNRIDELNRLRNNLFHNKPLTVYLTRGKIYNRKFNSRRLKAVNWILNLKSHQRLKKEAKDIYFFVEKYIKIKNSLRKVG